MKNYEYIQFKSLLFIIENWINYYSFKTHQNDNY